MELKPVSNRLPPHLRPLGWLLGAFDLTFVVLNWIGGSILGWKTKFFSNGWGDLEAAESYQNSFLDDLENGKTDALDIGSKIKWGAVKNETDATITEATFESPCADMLPPESKQAKFYLVTPTANKQNVYIVMLPATGEMGKSTRLKMARKLAKQYGWSSLIVTAPYYASRKPSNQKLFFMNTVSDLVNQANALSFEAAALTLYLLQQSSDSRVCLTGFSWGAAMCATSAATALLGGADGNRLVCAPYVGSASPVCLADGVLASAIDWAALEKVTHSHSKEVRKDLYDEFNKTQLSMITKRLEDTRIGCIRLVVSSDDRFLKPRYSQEFLVQLRGLGTVHSEVIPGGHITAMAVRPWCHEKTIVEAVLGKT